MKKTQLGSMRVGVALASQTSTPDLYQMDLVGALVRQAIATWSPARVDADAPMTACVKPGMTVLLKPNWVIHQNLGPGGTRCLYTQHEFIEAVILEVLKARPAKIIVGDAPIQSAQWKWLAPVDSVDRWRALCQQQGVQFELIDFRCTVVQFKDPQLQGLRSPRDRSRYVKYDLQGDSLLEPITSPHNPFRTTDYDPERTRQAHDKGHHSYLLCREAFEADAVISLPKLKTHSKVGLTAALKNLVGLNGDKDFLAHHRKGGGADGGDCYPYQHLGKKAAEELLDFANRRLGTSVSGVSRRLARWVVGKSSPGDLNLEGSWHGNDTCWRMVVDLNRILVYGKTDGTMADQPQRRVFSLTDAIIGGEGEGPLAPSPVRIGAVTFADNSVAADTVHAYLLRLDPRKMRLIAGAAEHFKWPLVQGEEIVVAMPGVHPLTSAELGRQHGVSVIPAKGWRGTIEWDFVS
jgi:uncharacterized protein (DUF362 family)